MLAAPEAACWKRNTDCWLKIWLSHFEVQECCTRPTADVLGFIGQRWKDHPKPVPYTANSKPFVTPGTLDVKYWLWEGNCFVWQEWLLRCRLFFYVQIRSCHREGIKNVFLLQQSLSAPLTSSLFQNYVFLVDLFLGTFLYSCFSYYTMHYCPFPLWFTSDFLFMSFMLGLFANAISAVSFLLCIFLEISALKWVSYIGFLLLFLILQQIPNIECQLSTHKVPPADL